MVKKKCQTPVMEAEYKKFRPAVTFYEKTLAFLGGPCYNATLKCSALMEMGESHIF